MMKAASGRIILAGLTLLAALPIGCGSQQTVEFRYQRPAQYDIPSAIRRVGIAEFGGKSKDDKYWGDIASDRLAAELETYNRKFDRYELVDRKRLKAVLDERDLQLAVSDTATAGQAGKIANVNAMIYGSVSVTIRNEQVAGTTVNPISRSVSPTTHTRRYCIATVNFTMDDIDTGKTLATASPSREYDSDKPAEGRQGSGGSPILSGAKNVMGFNSEPPPAEKIVSDLIDQCVYEFLSKISPHEIVVKEPLLKGKSDQVKVGNTLAAAKDYAQALEAYLEATRLNADDHQAYFNAGLMYEATGKLDEAAGMYAKAFQIKPTEQYALARKRAQTENAK
jgi:tetratricopeptide (TPR) repeat protein